MVSTEEVVRVSRRAVQQELTAWKALLLTLQDALAAPAPGSPWAQYMDWEAASSPLVAKTSRELRTAGLRAVTEALTTASEHARAACRLLDDPTLAIPSLAASRSVHDAVLPVLWLADPCVSPQQRMARLAAHYLDYVQEHHRLLTNFWRVVPETTIRGALDQVREAQRTLEETGFALRRHGVDPERVVGLTFEGEQLDVRLQSTRAARAYTPGLARQYTVSSGATHTRMWLTPGMRVGGSDTPAAIALPLFDIADYLADGLLPLLGVDPHPIHVATHRRRTAVHETARPKRPNDVRLGYEEWARRREVEVTPPGGASGP